VASAWGCFCNPIEGSHWAYHFSPILYPVAIAFAAIRTPLTLVTLQAVAGALVAPPIYALVRARSGVLAGRLAATVAWLYPPLAGLIFGDFHENGFAPAAVAWTVYAFDSERLGLALSGALVTLCIKEDQAVFLAIAGGLSAWRYRGTQRGAVAAAIAIVSLAVLVAFFALIRPHAAVAAAPWQPERFYAWGAPLSSSVPAEIAARLGFLLLIFVPLLFLPFRSRAMWVAAAPLGEVLLSRMPTTFTLGTHYAGAWIGYVMAAFAFAVRKLPPRRARTILAVCAGLCILELAVADPLHPGLNLRRPQARDVALGRFLRTLPRDANVATQEEAYTHLAAVDPYAQLVPESPTEPVEACLVLLDWSFPQSPRLQEYGAAFLAAMREGRYIRIAASDGIALYRRVGACR